MNQIKAEIVLVYINIYLLGTNEQSYVISRRPLVVYAIKNFYIKYYEIYGVIRYVITVYHYGFSEMTSWTKTVADFL